MHFGDYARGDYSALRQIIGKKVGPTDLERTWLSHIQRKGVSGEWRSWFTPEDVAFVRKYFAEYNAEFGYGNDEIEDYNTVPMSPELGSGYILKKYATRKRQITYLTSGEGWIPTEEEARILVIRARDGNVDATKKLSDLMKAGTLAEGIVSDDELKKFDFFSSVMAR